MEESAIGKLVGPWALELGEEEGKTASPFASCGESRRAEHLKGRRRSVFDASGSFLSSSCGCDASFHKPRS